MGITPRGRGDAVRGEAARGEAVRRSHRVGDGVEVVDEIGMDGVALGVVEFAAAALAGFAAVIVARTETAVRG